MEDEKIIDPKTERAEAYKITQHKYDLVKLLQYSKFESQQYKETPKEFKQYDLKQAEEKIYPIANKINIDDYQDILSKPQQNDLQRQMQELRTKIDKKNDEIFRENRNAQTSFTTAQYKEMMQKRSQHPQDHNQSYQFYRDIFYPQSQGLLKIIDVNKQIKSSSEAYIGKVETAVDKLVMSHKKFLSHNTPEIRQIKEKFLQLSRQKNLFDHTIQSIQFPSKFDITLKRYGVNIDANNLKEFLAGQWLSNTTIDFVCEYFMEKQLLSTTSSKPNLIIQYRIFNQQFDPKKNRLFDEIKKQYLIPPTQSIFEAFRFIGIPVNINENHWVSIAVDTESKIIHVFDSILHGQNDRLKQDRVGVLLNAIEACHPNTRIQYKVISQIQVEQQNGLDCGVFVLKFLQIMMFQGLDSNKHHPFTQEDVTQLRKNLYYLIPMACVGQDNDNEDEEFDSTLLNQIEDGSIFRQ